MSEKKGPAAGGGAGEKTDQPDCTPSLANLQEQLAQYAACVFDPGDIIEIRRRKSVKSWVSTWHTAAELPQLAEALIGYHHKGEQLFVGANPRTARGNGSSAATCITDGPCGKCFRCVDFARCVFVDIDGGITVDEVQFRLKESGLPTPTMLIASGGGAHFYWRFEEPMKDLDRWSRIQKGLIALLDSDPSVHDWPRVMRIPGIPNTKYTPARLCRIVESHPDRNYPVKEFTGLETETSDRSSPPAPLVVDDSLVPGGGRATSGWVRVSKALPCPICRKPDWCGVSADGCVAVCMRVTSDRPTRNGGHLHQLRKPDGSRRPFVRRATAGPNRRPTVDFLALSARYEREISDSRVEELARSQGVSIESLGRLHIGWDGEAFTFPMRDASGRIIGIRRSLLNGAKYCVTGSKTGLFLPDAIGTDDLLFIAEGESDTAALLMLGFSVIGRPSCTGGAAHVVEFASGRAVVIVADADSAGQRGGLQLARELHGVCPSVRIIIPPTGVKDARAWLNAGATHSDIDMTLDNGPIVHSARRSNRADGDTLRETG